LNDSVSRTVFIVSRVVLLFFLSLLAVALAMGAGYLSAEKLPTGGIMSALCVAAIQLFWLAGGPTRRSRATLGVASWIGRLRTVARGTIAGLLAFTWVALSFVAQFGFEMSEVEGPRVSFRDVVSDSLAMYMLICAAGFFSLCGLDIWHYPDYSDSDR